MSDRICRALIGAGKLVARTPVLIERDERTFPLRVQQIVRPNVMGQPERQPDLVHDTLLEGLTSTSTIAAIGAAFVAGRCTTGDSFDDAATAAALHALLASFDPASLRNRAQIYVEAVLSMGLLGDVDAAGRLRDLVTVPANDSIAGYLAAAYLGQFGDAAGYPVLHKDLNDRSDGHARTMAVRNLLSFVVHDGKQVGSLTIDVRRDYLARLRDKDDDVAAEVPGLMVEAGLTGIEDELRAATKRPFPKSVRETAEEALTELASRK